MKRVRIAGLVAAVSAAVAPLPAAAQLAPPSAGGVNQQQLDAVLQQVREELAARGLDSVEEVEEATEAGADVSGWPDLTEAASLPTVREVVHPRDRSLRILTQPLRHTTVMLAADERIVDIVLGDALYFEVTGADNVVFIKPFSAGRRTSLSLTTQYDRTYAIDLFATEQHRPDEVVRVNWHAAPSFGPEREFAPGAAAAGFHERRLALDFVPSAEVDALERRLERVRREHRRVEQDAQQQLASVERLAEQRVDEFKRTFPRRIEARYRLSPQIQSPPLHVHQMFTDGQFTYVRSTAQESPALYTLTGVDGSEPRLVNVSLTPDGLYVIDHVVGAGYAQLYGARGEWHVWDTPPMTILPEVVRAGLPADGLPPRWIRAGEARSWAAKHPKLLGWLVGTGIAGSITMALVF